MRNNLIFNSFKNKVNVKDTKKLYKHFNKINNIHWPKFFDSFKKDYNYSFDKKFLKKYQKYKKINIIGMGGSVLGAKAIYSFCKATIKKNFSFFENLQLKKCNSNKSLNIVISKSGNTLETLVNLNANYNKTKNIFITENKLSHLRNLANKLKSDVIDHKNFIGGRFSVLSEVGMLPAGLMGLNENKFKQFNNLLKNKYFFNAVISNVTNIVELVNKKKSNAVILNYDETLDNFLKWYQQLLAESIGKKAKGIFPIISTMPKDNHSLMQLYLDGQKNNFYTFFSSVDKISPKINKETILRSKNFLINKNLQDILDSKILATQKVFKKKRIPFRSFFLKTRKEETLGELFTFFVVETILIAKALKINPYDQPAVELIKKETNKILVNS